MRYFLRQNPRCDQAWAILITENSLPQFNIPQGRPWHVGQLEDLLRNAAWRQATEARKAVLSHPAIAWITDGRFKVQRFANKRHRVAFCESLSNPLSSQELMLGVSFRFVDRSHAAAFKLAWGNDASPDLITYRPSPYKKSQPLAAAA